MFARLPFKFNVREEDSIAEAGEPNDSQNSNSNSAKNPEAPLTDPQKYDFGQEEINRAMDDRINRAMDDRTIKIYFETSARCACTFPTFNLAFNLNFLSSRKLRLKARLKVKAETLRLRPKAAVGRSRRNKTGGISGIRGRWYGAEYEIRGCSTPDSLKTGLFQRNQFEGLPPACWNWWEDGVVSNRI
jgi:hypothetical protein